MLCRAARNWSSSLVCFWSWSYCLSSRRTCIPHDLLKSVLRRTCDIFAVACVSILSCSLMCTGRELEIHLGHSRPRTRDRLNGCSVCGITTTARRSFIQRCLSDTHPPIHVRI